MKPKPVSHRQPSNLNGFTIIELLVATLVFSIVLVVVLAAFVQISRLYYKGVSMANTQNDTRIITQDLENDIQYSSKVPSGIDVNFHKGAAIGSFCVGQHVYEYQLFHVLGSGAGDYALRRSDGSNCAPSTINREELLGTGMQLNAIKIDCAQYQRCTVHVHVIYYGGASSTPDMFYSPTYSNSTKPWQEPDAECTGSLTDTQICAVADFDRTVLQTI